MVKIEDEALKTVNGGAMTENDYQSLLDYLRLQKDMGYKLNDVLAKVIEDFNNKIDYYDLIDTDGKPVGLDDLLGYVKQYWEEV